MNHCAISDHRIALMLDQSVLLLGIVPFLVAHLRDDNKVDMHTRCTFNHRYVKSNPREVENATWMLTIFHCFGQYFCLHFEAFQLGMALVYMGFLHFIGDENDARTYRYSLEVGASVRKLIWEGTSQSIHNSATERSGIAMMVSLFNEIWHFSSLVVIGKN